ncbi:hypothetical protein ACF0H5_013802 [Mactra antiquata]
MRILTGLVLLVILPYIRMEQVSDANDLRLIREELSHFARRVEELEIRDSTRAKENEELKARIGELEATTQRQQKELDLLKNLQEEAADSQFSDNLTTDIQLTDVQSISSRSISKKHRKSTHKILPSLHSEQVMIDRRQTDKQAKVLQRIKNQANQDTSVAFFSTMSTVISNTGSDQQIPFQNVITNVGNGYNKYSGDFRVPVSGVYVFSATITPHTGQHGHFYYVVNGRAESYFYSHYGSSATQQVVLNLNAGDTIAVHASDAGYRIEGSGYSSFSGFLLQRPSGGVAVVGK